MTDSDITSGLKEMALRCERNKKWCKQKKCANCDFNVALYVPAKEARFIQTQAKMIHHETVTDDIGSTITSIGKFIFYAILIGYIVTCIGGV
jgi:hypothetical protein